jgi:hypothetical protein
MNVKESVALTPWISFESTPPSAYAPKAPAAMPMSVGLFRDHKSDHLRGSRAERDAHSDLAHAITHAVRQHATNANGGEQEGESGERREQPHAEAPLR